MFRTSHMPRADRRRWRAARDLADLGHLMADWLEGRISSQPGYLDDRPDPETANLIPVLAACNRGGFLTTDSQPGVAEDIHGDPVEQRAMVSGHVADPGLLVRLAVAANDAGLLVSIDGEPGIAYSTVPLTRNDLRDLWWPCRRATITDVHRATQVTIAAPELGAIGDRLWDVVAAAVASQPTRTCPKCSSDDTLPVAVTLTGAVGNYAACTRCNHEWALDQDVHTHDETEFVRYTADVVLLTQDGQVLLIERIYPPFADTWALPGGHVDPGETSREAAVRELAEETGISIDPADLRQLGIFDAPGRDPRGRYVTVAYAATVKEPIPPAAGDDARAARWWPLDDLPKLAFDHANILVLDENGVARQQIAL